MTKYYLKKCTSYILLGTLVITSTFSTGCTKTENDNTSPRETAASLVEKETSAISADVNNAPKLSTNLYNNDTTYSAADLKVQQEFETYLKDIFTETYEQNPLTLNFLIEDTTNFDIEKIPSEWPSLDLEELAAYADEIEEYTAELNEFSYDSLTFEQQLIYDTLSVYFENEQDFPDSYLYSSPFSLNGIPSQLPLIFTEYTIETKEDIENYLHLMETLADYVSSEISFEKHLIENGYIQSAYSYEACLKQCENFLKQGNDYLSNIFQEKIHAIDGISEDMMERYISKNNAAIETMVIPAYNDMIENLKYFLTLDTNDEGLCHKKNGKKYYRYLLQSDVGTSKSPDELIDILDENIDTYTKDLMKLVLADNDLAKKIMNPDYVLSDPEEIMNYLIKKTEKDFPESASTQFELNEIDEAMADELSVAFYILSPIDNYHKNIIYVNPERTSDGNSLFPTLAHEGFPGHLYQHDYFCSLNPSYFRSLLSFTGYAEGWAEYVELYSYDWSGLDDNTAAALKLDMLLSDAIPTRIDLGVNYEGWSVDDVGDYLTTLGYDDSYADTYYDTVISAPTVFFSYYIGYVELMELRDYAQETLKDNFSIKDFHRFYLEIGPTYFDIIEDYMKNSLETKDK